MSFSRKVTAAAAATFLVGVLLGQFAPEPTRLVFLSVGQGDSALYDSGGNDILIDTGPSGEHFDAGESLVVPKLRKLGVRHLALVILSHPDNDHVGGTRAVLRQYPDARLMISDYFRQEPKLNADFAKWKVKPSEVLWVKQPIQLSFGKTRIRVVAPVPNGDDNTGSLFVHIDDGGATAVLSGDADVATEEAVGRRGLWQSQVLKAGHHGSRTATGDAWLADVKPRFAIISCGRDNSYGHPNKAVLDRLASHHIPALRTDLEGDLMFEARDGQFVRVTR